MPNCKSQLFVAMLIFFALGSVPAQAKLTNANLKGSYSFLLNQWTEPRGSQGAALGTLTFDGVSAVSSGSITIVNGTGLVVVTVASGSTYSVKPNGTGSMTLMLTGSGGNQTVTIDFVLNSVSASVAKSLQLLGVNNQSTNTNVLGGAAISTNLSSSASAANISGTYSFQLNSWTTGTQQAIVGTLTFDGVSTITLTYTQQNGPGSIITGTGSGTYSVNSDGSGSFSATLSNGNTAGVDFELNSVSAAVAKGLQLLTSDATSTDTVTGSAVHQ